MTRWRHAARRKALTVQINGAAKDPRELKQRFCATVPGAVIAVGSWIGLSYLLGMYFRHFANFNKIYGSLAAAIVLMMWLYWTGFALLLGAELNEELAKLSGEGKLQKKETTTVTSSDLAA